MMIPNTSLDFYYTRDLFHVKDDYVLKGSLVWVKDKVYSVYEDTPIRRLSSSNIIIALVSYDGMNVEFYYGDRIENNREFKVMGENKTVPNPVDELLKYKKDLEDKGLVLHDKNLSTLINSICSCLDYLDKRK